MPEIMDIYDANGNRTGKTFIRGTKLPEGCYRRGVQVWVRNDQGQFLLSQRHPRKIKPLFWEATGGAVDAGEDSLSAGVREVAEELGLHLEKEQLQLLCTTLGYTNEFLDAYMAVWNGSIGELKFQETEVVDARWATYDEMLELERQGILVSDNRELFRHVPNVPAAICPMDVRDYEEIYDLWTRIPGMGMNNLDDSREGIDKFLKRNPGCCFVAKTENGIVGTIMAGHDGRRAHLYHVAVLPECRGLGLGKALVQSALDALEVEGIAKVSITAFADNPSGIAFWAHLGFVDRQDVKHLQYQILDMVRFDVK